LAVSLGQAKLALVRVEGEPFRGLMKKVSEFGRGFSCSFNGFCVCANAMQTGAGVHGALCMSVLKLVLSRDTCICLKRCVQVVGDEVGVDEKYVSRV
jgi:hypothetical protein